LKNLKFIYGSGLISQWLGFYEKKIIKKIIKHLESKKIYYDIGAHVGYYTLLFSKFGEKVYSFEPEKTNFEFLIKHIKLNKLNNVFAFNFAIYSHKKTLFFEVNEDRTEGKISEKGNLKIKAYSLDYLCFEKKLDLPDFIKIDVEGAEFEVLKGAKKVIKTKAPKILLATHGEELKNTCIEFIKNMKYKIIPITNSEFLLVPQ